MRRVVVLLSLCACGGPSHDQLVETPAATSRRAPSTAPPASTSDQDRDRLIQQFDDMETTQRAYEEAGDRQRQPPRPPLPGQPPAPGVKKKKGVAEQAPPEPPKKKGPAEQAPSE